MSFPVPKVARVLLRVEWMDGQVREFDADQPRDLDVSIGRDEPLADFEAWAEALGQPAGQWMPERPLVPDLVYDGAAASVVVSFKASQDGRRHPFTIREAGERDPKAGENDRNRAALDDVREIAGNFLAEYGTSELSMFKVGQDLASAILKLIPAEPGL